MCGKPLGESFDDVESEHVRFRVEKGAEEPHPPSEDKPWVSQHHILPVTYVLRANLSRVFYIQRVEALEESPLIVLVLILLRTLDVFSKKPYV